MKQRPTGYGSILRFERQQRQWSQEKLANQLMAISLEDNPRLDLDTKTIGRWEREESMPSPYYQQLLCRVYGKSAKQLGFLH